MSYLDRSSIPITYHMVAYRDESFIIGWETDPGNGCLGFGNPYVLLANGWEGSNTAAYYNGLGSA